MGSEPGKCTHLYFKGLQNTAFPGAIDSKDCFPFSPYMLLVPLVTPLESASIKVFSLLGELTDGPGLGGSACTATTSGSVPGQCSQLSTP